MEFDHNIRLNVSKSGDYIKKEVAAKEKSAPEIKREEKLSKLPNSPEYWQNITFRGNKKQSPVYERFDRNLENPSCNASLCVDRSNCGDDILDKVSEMVESGAISGKAFDRFLSRAIGTWKNDNWQYFPEVVKILYEDSKTEDKVSCKMFENILDEKLLRISSGDAKKIKNLITNPNSFSLKYMEYGRELANADGVDNIFSDIESYKNYLSLVSEENFEDYKEFIEKQKQNGEYYTSAMWNANNYKNPVSGLYDNDIFQLEKAIREKYNKPGKYYVESTTRQILPHLVSGASGKIDSDLIKFAEDIYFIPRYGSSESGIFNKISQNIKKSRRMKHGSFVNNMVVEDNLPAFIMAAKDKNGAPCKKNMRYLQKITDMGKYSALIRDDNLEAFNMLKDENGVIDDNKFKTIERVLGEFPYASSVKSYVEIMNKYGNDCAREELERVVEIIGGKAYALDSLTTYVNNCLDENGKEIKEKAEYFEKLAPTVSWGGVPNEIFDLPQTDETVDLLKRLADKTDGISSSDVSSLADIYNKYSKNGKLSTFVKARLLAYSSKNFTPFLFNRAYEACNNENGFDDKLFKKIALVYSTETSLGYELNPVEMAKLINGEVSVSKFSFASRIKLLNALDSVKTKNKDNPNADLKFIDKITDDIELSLTRDTVFSPVEKDKINNFKAAVFGNKKLENEKYTEFEKTLKDSIPLLKGMEKGVPLSYSREDFLNNLSAICDTKEKKDILAEKTGIELITSGNKIIGYNGMLMLNDLDITDELENSIYSTCHEFLYNNEVNTGDDNLDKQLNTIIKAAPEFINTIGKKQHGTHKYTLDIHQLLVLANSIDNPEYQNLNSQDKTMLKMACIFHDIAKHENTVDKGHQNLSAYYMKSIVNKFFKNEENKDRLYELVKNHHWLEEYSTSTKADKENKIAFQFRRPNDFDIAKIMAKSDLMSVNDTFYDEHKNALDKSKIQPIEDKLNKYYATGNALFTDFPVYNAIKMPTQNINGKECKVINLHDVDKGESVEKYGFRKDAKKEDLQFLVHMVDKNEMKRSLSALKYLTSSSNEGALSESLITCDKKRTYCFRKYGVILSQLNTNIINEDFENQGSGTSKDLTNAVNLAFGDYNGIRNTFKQCFLKNLKIDQKSITDEDYAEFYRNYLADKMTLSQIDDEKMYSIGKHKISGSDIKNAINKYQKEDLLAKNNTIHNEIVGYAPKIKAVVAKEDSIDKVPEDLINFAHENNLPIVLL